MDAVPIESNRLRTCRHRKVQDAVVEGQNGSRLLQRPHDLRQLERAAQVHDFRIRKELHLSVASLPIAPLVARLCTQQADAQSPLGEAVAGFDPSSDRPQLLWKTARRRDQNVGNLLLHLGGGNAVLRQRTFEIAEPRKDLGDETAIQERIPQGQIIAHPLPVTPKLAALIIRKVQVATPPFAQARTAYQPILSEQPRCGLRKACRLDVDDKVVRAPSFAHQSEKSALIEPVKVEMGIRKARFSRELGDARAAVKVKFGWLMLCPQHLKERRGNHVIPYRIVGDEGDARLGREILSRESVHDAKFSRLRRIGPGRVEPQGDVAQPRLGLPRTVWRLGWISFFADICSEMAYPVLPLFLTGALRTPVAAIGLIEGIAEAIVSIMKGWSGFRSDKIGARKPFIVWGYSLSGVSKPLIAAAGTWPLVLFARALDRFGKGIRTTARDAMIADAVDAGSKGKAFGFHRAMDTAGAFVGVLLALGLLWLLPGEYRLIFLLAGIPGVLSVFIAISVRETPRAEPQSVATTRTPLDVRTLSPAYWRALGLTCLFAVANSSDTFPLLRAKDLGYTETQVILAYLGYNVVVALLSTWAGTMSDRLGRWRLIAAGWTLYAAAYVGFALAGAAWIPLLFGVYGLYYALAQGVGKALVADHSPASHRGSAMGLFYMVSGFATLAGNALTGALWTFVSPERALLTSGLIALIAAILIPLTGRAIRRAQPQAERPQPRR